MASCKGSIGVFDSGVGGLTVVSAILRRFPAERVLYVADQAHVPYGGRPLDEVCQFATGISRFLADQGCRAVVMACNISSATALPTASALLAPLPVLGVIGPAARRAARDAARPIGVLATEGTVKSGAYAQQVHLHNAGAVVVQVPCPKFVPLVESGALDTAAAYAAAREYLAPLADAGCGSVVLGCTHYPFLLHTLRRVALDLFTQPVEFIDPAEETGDALLAALPDLGSRSGGRPSLLLSTASAELFREQACRFLPGAEYDVAGAEWRGERVVLAPAPARRSCAHSARLSLAREQAR